MLSYMQNLEERFSLDQRVTKDLQAQIIQHRTQKLLG